MDGLIDVTCTIYPLFDKVFNLHGAYFLEGNKFKLKLYLSFAIRLCGILGHFKSSCVLSRTLSNYCKLNGV